MPLISGLKSRLDYYWTLDFEINWLIQERPFQANHSKYSSQNSADIQIEDSLWQETLLQRRLKTEDIKLNILQGTTKPTKLVKQLIRRANSLY